MRKYYHSTAGYTYYYIENTLYILYFTGYTYFTILCILTVIYMTYILYYTLYIYGIQGVSKKKVRMFFGSHISRNMKHTKVFLIWLAKGDLHVHSEYRMGSVQQTVTKIFVKQYRISNHESL